MIKDICSPYLSSTDVIIKPKKIRQTESFSQSKERKTIIEQLQLMRIRVKHLEKQEKSAKEKAEYASNLTLAIIKSRIKKDKKKEYKENLKKIKEHELELLKQRNQEMKQEIRFSIQMKKDEMLEKKRISARFVKELQLKERPKASSIIVRNSCSITPRILDNTSRVERKDPYVLEDREATLEAIKEIQNLGVLERKLIEKLKQAYEVQKTAEIKVSSILSSPIVKKVEI